MSDTIHVFAGPSLPPAARPARPDIVFHGPAAQGDVYALVGQRPFAIGIIDGYFERVPAVWHKEILWALSAGIHVFGAASMGALRAAELAAFGMVGVGRIYQDFAAGRFTDDDEVTIIHADADQGYRPLSEAMVNIRATMDAAAQQGVLSAEHASALVAAAKQRFYPDRSFPALLDAAKEMLPFDAASRFTAWLTQPAHRIDQKRLDAIALLGPLGELRERGPGRPSVPWTFQHTDAWEQVRRSFLPRLAEKARAAPPVAVLEGARLRALEIDLARREGFNPSAADFEWAVRDYCQVKGLATREALLTSLEADRVPWAEFERLMKDQACVRWSRLVLSVDQNGMLADMQQLAPRPVGRSSHADAAE